MVELNSAKHQVVSGSLFHIRGIFKDKSDDLFDCHVTIWDQPWMGDDDRYAFKLVSQVPHTTGFKKPTKEQIRRKSPPHHSSESSSEDDE